MSNNDWNGNYHSIYVTLGASNHTNKEREQNDYYATEPRAVELLLDKETFSPLIWEPACGEGHIAKVLEGRGHDVISTDLIDRGYGKVLDFLKVRQKDLYCNPDNINLAFDIITNPPYKFATEFVEQALSLVQNGNKVAMFLKLTFLEGKNRRKLFELTPPKTVYVASGRLLCAMNGDFVKYHSSAVAYAWFVWEKGFAGKPTIEWIN